MQSEPIDLRRILEALDSEPGLRYVLVGGMAVIAHGGSRITKDADFAISFDVENRHRLVKALKPLNPRPMRLAEGAGWVWDEKSIRAPWSIFATDAGRIDLIVRLPNVDSFDGLYERSVIFPLGGLSLRVASVDDLITLKTGTDRSIDEHDLLILRALKNLVTNTGEPSG